MQLKVYPLPLLRLKSSKSIVTYLVDIFETVESYSYIWYIDGARERILVDAGGSAETMLRRGHSAEQIASPEEALERVNLKPADIDIIICTHLHNDHNELGHLYKNAQFIIQKAELEANSNPHPIEAPFLDFFFYKVLPRIGAHEFIVSGYDYRVQSTCVLRHFLYIDCASDI